MLLKHKEDYRTLFILMTNLSVYIYGILYFQKITVINYFSFLVLGSLLAFSSTLINHNHRHTYLFSNNVLNRLTNIMISILIGAPSTRVHLVHQENHHRFYPSHEDWSHFELNAKGIGVKRVLSYFFNATSLMNKNRETLLNTGLKKTMVKEERIGILIFSIAVLFYNWKFFICLLIPTWFIALFLLLTSNLLNHDFCNVDNSVNNSRDFISPVENWFFCNNGFHTAHHLFPGLHWTNLPEVHRTEVLPKKNSTFVEYSFFSFILRYILWTPSIQNMEAGYLKRKS